MLTESGRKCAKLKIFFWGKKIDDFLFLFKHVQNKEMNISIGLIKFNFINLCKIDSIWSLG